MPIAYYGSKISPHMTETPEGFLICHDVPINRVGVQDYNGYELNMNGADSARTFKVLRPPREVFDAASLASFEGKPITDNHPPENVTPDNIHAFARGHAQNVRKGTGGNEGYSIADLYITDPQLIEDVKNGKREISCGYTYDLFPNKNGTFEQRRIRGNHIAVVDEGRAGHRVAIKDSKPKSIERGKNMEKGRNSLWGRVMKVFANDENTTPEDLEELNKLKKPDEEAGDEEPAAVPAAVKKPILDPSEDDQEEKGKDGSPADSEVLNKILEILEGLKTMLAPKESEDELENLIHPEHEDSEGPDNGPNEEPEEPKDENEDSPEEQEPSVTISPEEIKEKNGEKGAMDSARQMAIGVRKILQKNIKDPKAFKLAAKDAAAEIRNMYGIPHSNQGYSDFINTTKSAGKSRMASDSSNLDYNKLYADQQKAYDMLNPHKQKEAK